MLDYKKILDTTDFEDMDLEVFQSQDGTRVEIGGDKKGILYLICRLSEFVFEDCNNCDFAEINFDAGIDLKSGSPTLCVFLNEKK